MQTLVCSNDYQLKVSNYRSTITTSREIGQYRPHTAFRKPRLQEERWQKPL